MKLLENKVAIVTASTRGIGLSCAEILSLNGAIVYLACRNEEKAKSCIKHISSKGGIVKFIYFDADKDETYESMIEDVVKNETRLDILINNFGYTNIQMDRDIINTDTCEFLEILNKNIKSVYMPCKKAIPYMIENGGGSIVNVSSIASIVPDLSRVAYTVSKSAINSLTKNIALQYAKNGIRCNAVLPGLINTDASMDNMDKSFLDSFLENVPLNRVGKPLDIAKAVLYFASDDSSYITGSLLEVAGGYALGTPQYSKYSK